MRRAGILKYLRRGIEASGLPALGVQEIVGANELTSLADVDVLCAYWLTEGETRRETERSDVTRIVGVVTLAVRPGEGVERLDAYADRLARFFAPEAPGSAGVTLCETRAGGVDLRAAVPPDPEARADRFFVYVAGVRRGDAEVADGRCKTTVYVDFDVYRAE